MEAKAEGQIEEANADSERRIEEHETVAETEAGARRRHQGMLSRTLGALQERGRQIKQRAAALERRQRNELALQLDRHKQRVDFRHAEGRMREAFSAEQRELEEHCAEAEAAEAEAAAESAEEMRAEVREAAENSALAAARRKHRTSLKQLAEEAAEEHGFHRLHHCRMSQVTTELVKQHFLQRQVAEFDKLNHRLHHLTEARPLLRSSACLVREASRRGRWPPHGVGAVSARSGRALKAHPRPPKLRARRSPPHRQRLWFLGSRPVHLDHR